MVKGFFGNLKKVWKCRKNFGGAGRKTLECVGFVIHDSWRLIHFT